MRNGCFTHELTSKVIARAVMMQKGRNLLLPFYFPHIMRMAGHSSKCTTANSGTPNSATGQG